MPHAAPGAKIPEELRRAAEFHTHLGPYLVVGVRMGHVVTRELGNEPFAYRLTVRTGRRPPYSCLADGLQVATPCTTGNGGLEVSEERTMSVEVTAKDGRALVLMLRSTVFDSIENECTEENQESFAMSIWKMPEESLLDVRRG